MASGPFSFFDPGEWSDPNAPPMAQVAQELLANPQVLAGLGQFGINLGGNRTWGGNSIFGAIGGAGEGVSRAQEQQRTEETHRQKMSESESRIGEREAKADIANRMADVKTAQQQVREGQLEARNRLITLQDLRAQNALRLKERTLDETLARKDAQIANAKDETERRRLEDERRELWRQGRLEIDRTRIENMQERTRLLGTAEERLQQAERRQQSALDNRTVLAIQEGFRRASEDITNPRRPRTIQQYLQQNPHLMQLLPPEFDTSTFPTPAPTQPPPTTPGPGSGTPPPTTSGGGTTVPPAQAQPTGPRPGGQRQKPPKAGDVVNGWRFKGGDPNDKANWEKVQQ